MEKPSLRGAGITSPTTDRVLPVAPTAPSEFARKFPLVPPSVDKQYRSQVLKAARSRRAAERRVGKALEAEPGRVARADPVQLGRVWSSFAFRDLRRSLTDPEQERLRAHLAAYMADETTPAVWHAAVNAVAALRRATDSVVGAPRC
jgi:hypothetical protein